MRRLAVVFAVVAVLAGAAWVSVGGGGHARAAIRPPGVPRVVPPRVVSPRVVRPAGAGACYVSIPRCSQTPCVEFAQASPAVQIIATMAVPRPVPRGRVVVPGPKRCVPRAGAVGVVRAAVQPIAPDRAMPIRSALTHAAAALGLRQRPHGR